MVAMRNKDESNVKTTSFKDTAKEFFYRNMILISVFAGVFILFTGLTLKNSPSMWWLPVVVVVFSLFIALLFANARVAVKAIITFAVTIFVSGFAMEMGSFMDPYSVGAFFWFTSFWFVIFASLAYSYVNVKGRSRWSTLIVSELVAFVVSYFVAFVFLSPILAALSTVVSGVLTFVLIYGLGASVRRTNKHMPINVSTENVSQNIFDDAERSDWNVRHIEKKNSDYYLVWRDRAFSLVPIVMDEQFGRLASRRGKDKGAGYHNRSINSWLSDMVHDKTMFFRSGGADVMVILLDLKNANGGEPKLFTVEMPDTKKPALVGIMPAAHLLSDKNTPHFFDKLAEDFSKVATKLTDKQFEAISRIGVKGASSVSLDSAAAVNDDTESDGSKNNEE